MREADNAAFILGIARSTSILDSNGPLGNIM